MALAEILDGLRGLIAAGTPAYYADVPFTLRELADPGPIEDVAVGKSRVVEVEAVRLLEGPNITDGAMRYASAALEVRVTYSAADFPERRGPMIAASADLVAVINAIRPPAAWASFAFEVTPDANEAQAEPVYGADGNVTGAILTIPVLAEWEV